VIGLLVALGAVITTSKIWMIYIKSQNQELTNAADLLKNASSFGDSFGPLSSLFSGFALIGLIYTVLMQKKELRLALDESKVQTEALKLQASQLKLQAEELAHSRKEMKIQTEVMDEQIEEFAKQHKAMLKSVEAQTKIVEWEKEKFEILNLKYNEIYQSLKCYRNHKKSHVDYSSGYAVQDYHEKQRAHNKEHYAKSRESEIDL